jgi:hypothetical protein
MQRDDLAAASDLEEQLIVAEHEFALASDGLKGSDEDSSWPVEAELQRPGTFQLTVNCACIGPRSLPELIRQSCANARRLAELARKLGEPERAVWYERIADVSAARAGWLERGQRRDPASLGRRPVRFPTSPFPSGTADNSDVMNAGNQPYG